MKNFNENPQKNLQLGAIEHNLCLNFRKQAAQRKFKQVEILRLLIEWWVSLDEFSQRNFYYSGAESADFAQNPLRKKHLPMNIGDSR